MIDLTALAVSVVALGIAAWDWWKDRPIRRYIRDVRQELDR